MDRNYLVRVAGAASCSSSGTNVASSPGAGASSFLIFSKISLTNFNTTGFFFFGLYSLLQVVLNLIVERNVIDCIFQHLLIKNPDLGNLSASLRQA